MDNKFKRNWYSKSDSEQNSPVYIKKSVFLEVCWGICKITCPKYDSRSIPDLLRNIVEFFVYKSREGVRKRERIDGVHELIANQQLCVEPWYKKNSGVSKINGESFRGFEYGWFLDRLDVRVGRCIKKKKTASSSNVQRGWEWEQIIIIIITIQ